MVVFCFFHFEGPILAESSLPRQPFISPSHLEENCGRFLRVLPPSFSLSGFLRAGITDVLESLTFEELWFPSEFGEESERPQTQL